LLKELVVVDFVGRLDTRVLTLLFLGLFEILLLLLECLLDGDLVLVLELGFSCFLFFVFSLPLFLFVVRVKLVF